jgi:hypothetical protein
MTSQVMANVEVAPKKKQIPFAARAQNFVITFLVVTMVMIAQPYNITIYGLGIYLLALAVFLQIAVSNVNPLSGVGGTIKKSAIIFFVIIVLFAFSIWITPTLVALGR